MRPLQEFYRKTGQTLGKVLGATDLPAFNHVHKQFVPQTPGRHVYYYAENHMQLPDSIKWEIRLPSRWAESEESKKYVPEVEKQILAYLEQQVGTNYLDPDRGFDLDLTLKEAALLAEAGPSLQEYAESGELQRISTAWKISKEAFEAERDAIYQKLHEIFEQTRADEAAAVEGTGITLGADLKATTSNVRAHLGKNPGDTGAQQALAKLKTLAHTHLQIAITEQEIIEFYLLKFPNAAVEKEAAELIKAQSADAVTFYSSFQDGTGDKVDTYDWDSYASTLTTFAENHNARERLISDLSNDDAQPFNRQLLHHLSTNIVVKEHKKRYQEEQYERFMLT